MAACIKDCKLSSSTGRSMRSIASRMSVMSGEGALSVFARAKELEAQGRSIIHLELGEPDFHPGKSVIESAAKALADGKDRDRKSTRLNSSHLGISYAVFCL